MRVTILIALLSLWAGCAAEMARAGAWPREEGETFLSFGGHLVPGRDDARAGPFDPAIYLEYGLTPRLTFGVDGYLAEAGSAGSLFAWLRLPWRAGEGAHVRAVSAGLGLVAEADGEREAATRIGLHWGRGLETGWLALDAQAERGLARGRHRAKIEATLGLRLSPRWSALMQGHAGQSWEGGTYGGASAGLVIHATPRFDLRAGLTRALTGDRGGGLALEGWWRF